MSSYSLSKGTTKSIFITSVLIGFFADIKCVNAFLVAVNPALAGAAMPILYAATMFLILAVTIFSPYRKSLTFKNLVVPIYCMALYVLTMTFIDTPRVSFLVFIVFTIMAYLIPLMSTIEVRTTLRAIMFFSSFSILKLDVIFAFAFEYNDAISMGTSYAYLIPVLASFVYSVYYLRKDKGIQIYISLFLILTNLVFFVKLFVYGSRGPLLAIACCFIFMMILTKKNPHYLVINKRRLILMLFMLIFLIMSFALLSNMLAGFLESIGISSYSLDKIVRMQENGDLSNGRNELSALAFNGFCEHPILGHGLDLFDSRYKDSSYPHNFILQILYDGGLLFFVLLIIPAMTHIRRLFRNAYFHQIVFFVFMFCASVPGALFSGDLWELNMLWMFFGFIQNKKFITHEI